MRDRDVRAKNVIEPPVRCRCQAVDAQSGFGSWLMRLVVAALLLAMALAIPVHAQDSGVFEGQVVNGTEGGEEIGAGIAVNLYRFSGSVEEDVLSTETDSEGRFRFEGLDTSPDLQYWAEAIYLDVSYGSEDLLQFAEGQTTLDTAITVYETTQDDSGVQLDLVHIFAESFGQVLRISETHLFGSTADRTYVGQEDAEGQLETVLVPIPADSVGFALGEGIAEDRFVSVSEGLVDTDPVRPGTLMSEVRFSYHLAVGTDPITLERPFAYPVASLAVLVAQPGLALSSPQLQSMGTQMIQDRQYEVFSGQGLGPGMPLELEFTSAADEGSGLDSSGMPTGQVSSSGTAVGSQSVLLWLGVVLAAASVAGVFVYTATTGRPSASRPAGPRLSANPKAKRLLHQLADLEDSLEAGEVDEVAYERQRAEITAELRSL
jgi:hypothetical protein